MTWKPVKGVQLIYSERLLNRCYAYIMSKAKTIFGTQINNTLFYTCKIIQEIMHVEIYKL